MLNRSNCRIKFSLLVVLALILFYLTWYFYDENLFLEKELKEPMKFKNNNEACENYRRNCFDLYRRLRNPDPKTVFKIPPEKIPEEFYAAFVQNGENPISKYYYFNNAYSDSNSDDKSKKLAVDINAFNSYREKVKKWQPLGYDDLTFHIKMDKFKKYIQSRSIAIIGTVSPWIEAISYELNASRIITLDYTRKYWHEKKLEWHHVNDFLDEMLQNQLLEQIDNAATFSSIEHSGLGRFGDPLSPDGDIEAMRQVHCMIKPGGLFFVGDLQTTGEEAGKMEWNAHRIFGAKRLRKMFEGWKLIEHEGNLYVLEKIGNC